MLHRPTLWCEQGWGVDDRARAQQDLCHHWVITPHACLACHRQSPCSVHVRLRHRCVCVCRSESLACHGVRASFTCGPAAALWDRASTPSICTNPRATRQPDRSLHLGIGGCLRRRWRSVGDGSSPPPGLGVGVWNAIPQVLLTRVYLR